MPNPTDDLRIAEHPEAEAPAQAEVQPAAPDAPMPPEKKIILLSDGTGNSERSPFKTNVWRTYQALTLADGSQVARYDDGVGTSAVKPLAILGGAFGWGLKRNVLELYKFLCRVYQPEFDADGRKHAADDIYGFGFSRGAFTIRVLAGLIQDQGLVRYWNEDGTAMREETLTRYASAAYRVYRGAHFHAPLARIGRVFRDAAVFVRDRVLGLTPYDREQNIKPVKIRFLGLWDTVDAYGMPIRELKRAVDRWIWPMTFRSLELGDGVICARHALALDDERATFHPLVWDERDEVNKAAAGRVAPDRIRQVWFSGVHANVGGGYPDDALAHVPLLWILEEAENAGLEFEPEFLRLYRAAANPYGRMYDSRTGVATFYRYSPRQTDRSVEHRAYAQHAVIHPTVFGRMRPGLYAPISIHGSIAVYGNQGRRHVEYNRDAMELVLDTVWWRRTAHWVLLTLVALIASFPWTVPPFADLVQDQAGAIGSETTASNAQASALLSGSAIFALVRLAVPGFAQRWVDSFTAYPVYFLGLAVLGLVAFAWGMRLRDRVVERARAAWQARPDEQVNRADWIANIKARRRTSVQTLLIAAAAIAASGAVLREQRTAWDIVLAVMPLAVVLSERLPLQRLRQQPVGRWVPVGLTLRIARFFRKNGLAVAVEGALVNHVIPFLFVLGIFGTAFYALNAFGFGVLNAAGKVCTPSTSAARFDDVKQNPIVKTVDLKDPCFATGVALEKHAKYRIDISAEEPWKDASIALDALPAQIRIDGERRQRVAADGYGSFEKGVPWFLVLGAPMRRFVGENWFKPIARVGVYGEDEFPLGAHSTLIEPRKTNELFLYVNDAVWGLPGLWNRFYPNNSGTMRVEIRLVERSPSY